jgi:rod shape-determining protein MreD
MLKNIIFLIFFFYFLVLIQSSFLTHFQIFSGSFGIWTPNLILITIILINFFEKPEKNLGIIAAFIGGFFLDLFSENFIGFYILISLGLAIFLKFIFKKYLRLEPIFKRPLA